ncbi:putative mitochondrial protein, partial [Mucuna pruriens]
MQLHLGFSCGDPQKYANSISLFMAYDKHNIINYSLFTYHSEELSLIVLVYVDDPIIARNNENMIEDFKTYLSNCFYMKDLENLKYFLGLEIARGLQGIFLCQQKYDLDIILEIGLLGTKSIGFPLKQNYRLALANGAILEDPKCSCQLVGKLIYLTISRPKLSYYGNLGQGIFLCSNHDLTLLAYYDSNWAILEKISYILENQKKQVIVSRSLA